MSLNRLNTMNWLKEVNVINNNDTSDLVKRVDYNIK